MRVMKALLIAACATAAPLAPALAGDGRGPAAEERLIAWRGELPACGDAGVLSDITARFARREAGFWNSALRIGGYERVREVAFRPWGASYIPRRFCSATAHVSDGERTHRRRVDYMIIDGMGDIGFGWRVQYCVSGVERHLHAAPDCRMMQP